jgi:hypothetical protein
MSYTLFPIMLILVLKMFNGCMSLWYKLEINEL